MVKILDVQTEHVSPFKILIEVLKEVLSDVTIEFRKNDDSLELTNGDNLDSTKSDEDIQNNSGGLRIMTIDSTKTMLINLKLEASQFSTFLCKSPKLELGINLITFNKLIRSMEKDDILSLYVDDDDRQHLCVQIDNPEKKCQTIFKLKLMDLDSQPFKVPSTTFDAVITIPSSEFHKICREMSHIAEYVEIKCSMKNVTFTCKGDSAERSSVYHTDENGISITFSNVIKNKTCVVQGIYELKNLVLFTKCSNLCNDIQIFMKNDYPLVIKYTVATLGRLLLCLTPIAEEGHNNYSDEEEIEINNQ
jgi:proliferating cell nuclear antigen